MLPAIWVKRYECKLITVTLVTITVLIIAAWSDKLWYWKHWRRLSTRLSLRGKGELSSTLSGGERTERDLQSVCVQLQVSIWGEEHQEASSNWWHSEHQQEAPSYVLYNSSCQIDHVTLTIAYSDFLDEDMKKPGPKFLPLGRSFQEHVAIFK